MNAALSNAERQRRWRERRNDRAAVLDGSPTEVAKAILAHLGKDRAQKVVLALNKRLKRAKVEVKEWPRHGDSGQ
jgi:predicted mannosyl-3-phosphoglycerate phosphatase (HAD superfamily)